MARSPGTAGGVRVHRGQPPGILLASCRRVPAAGTAASGAGDQAVSEAGGDGRPGAAGRASPPPGWGTAECFCYSDSGRSRTGPAPGAMAGAAGGAVCEEDGTVPKGRVTEPQATAD